MPKSVVLLTYNKLVKINTICFRSIFILFSELVTDLTSANYTECVLFLSCPGNPMEQCGCRQFFNLTKVLPLLADVSNLGKKLTF